jgi:hypothetical protein
MLISRLLKHESICASAKLQILVAGVIIDKVGEKRGKIIVEVFV